MHGFSYVVENPPGPQAGPTVIATSTARNSVSPIPGPPGSPTAREDERVAGKGDPEKAKAPTVIAGDREYSTRKGADFRDGGTT